MMNAPTYLNESGEAWFGPATTTGYLKILFQM